jgi:hypothetical protein
MIYFFSPSPAASCSWSSGMGDCWKKEKMVVLLFVQKEHLGKSILLTTK